jgi:hypothetical protein
MVELNKEKIVKSRTMEMIDISDLKMLHSDLFGE